MTAKQEAFVREYLIDWNASAAARRAGYSERTAGTTGHENLKKPEIAKAIQEAERDRASRTEITADNVLRGLAGIAFDQAASNRDQTRALELLGRHLALFTDRIEHSGTVEFHHLDQIDTAIAELERQLDIAAAESDEARV